MKREYVAAIIAPLLLFSQQITAIAATPTVLISNISPNKVTVRPAGILKITWNFSSENLSMEEAKKMEVVLTPVSGVACQPSCPSGEPKLLSGTLSGGLWYSNIEIPGNVMATDYEVNVSMPGFFTKGSSAKSPTAITIVNDSDATDMVFVTPTILGTGWAPSIGPITRFKGGFKFKILNFNTNYTWNYFSWGGTAGIDGDGIFTISGLKAGIQIGVTISTKSSTGVNTSASFQMAPLPDAPFPLRYVITKQTKNSFSFYILNRDEAPGTTFRFEAPNQRFISRIFTNRGEEFTISDLPESSTSTIEVFMTSPSREESFGKIVGSTLPLPTPTPIAIPSPTTPTPTPTPTTSESAEPTLNPTPTSSAKAKKTITCVKGKTIKKVTNFNPKCPAGYKKK